jgi:hypothetical protein
MRKNRGEGDEWGGSLSACVLVSAALCVEAGQGKSQCKSAANGLLQVNSPDLSLKTQERNHA